MKKIYKYDRSKMFKTSFLGWFWTISELLGLVYFGLISSQPSEKNIIALFLYWNIFIDNSSSFFDYSCELLDEI